MLDGEKNISDNFNSACFKRFSFLTDSYAAYQQ